MVVAARSTSRAELLVDSTHRVAFYNSGSHLFFVMEVLDRLLIPHGVKTSLSVLILAGL